MDRVRYSKLRHAILYDLNDEGQKGKRHIADAHDRPQFIKNFLVRLNNEVDFLDTNLSERFFGRVLDLHRDFEELTDNTNIALIEAVTGDELSSEEKDELSQQPPIIDMRYHGMFLPGEFEAQVINAFLIQKIKDDALRFFVMLDYFIREEALPEEETKPGCLQDREELLQEVYELFKPQLGDFDYRAYRN